MKIRLKRRQTTLNATPKTASADMTENRIKLIGTVSSLGIPPAVQRNSGRRDERKQGTGRGRKREYDVGERGESE